MADKMMRLAGRNDEGLAKALKVDKKGTLLTKVSENLESGIRLRKKNEEVTLLNIPTYDGSGMATHPSVLYSANPMWGYKYWMTFTPYVDVAHENPSIVASNDGINWVVPDGLTNPIEPAPAGGYNSDTELVLSGKNSMRCYWRQTQTTPAGDSKLIYRETTDGITWSTRVECVMASYMDPLSPTIVRVGNTWTLYIGSTASSKNRLFYATSTDGITWSAFTACRTNVDGLLGFWHPEVRHFGSEYRCVVSAHHLNAHRVTSDPQLYYGTSADGKDWIFDKLPTIPYNTEPFSRRVYKSSLVQTDDGYLLYASGLSIATAKEQIGVVPVVIGNSFPDYDSLKTHETERLLRYGALTANTTSVFYSTKKPVEISGLEVASNSDTKALIYFEVANANGSFLHIPIVSSDGVTAESTLRFSNLRNDKNPWFEIVTDTDGKYKYMQKSGAKLYFPNGVQIRIRNTDATLDYNLAVSFVATTFG